MSDESPLGLEDARQWRRVDRLVPQILQAVKFPIQYDETLLRQAASDIGVITRRTATVPTIFRFLTQVYGLHGSRKMSTRLLVSRIVGNLSGLSEGLTPSADMKVTTGIQAAVILQAGHGLNDLLRLVTRIRFRFLTGDSAGLVQNGDFGKNFDRLLARTVLTSRQSYRHVSQLHGGVICLVIKSLKPRLDVEVHASAEMKTHNSRLVRSRLRQYTQCPHRRVVDCQACSLTVGQCSISPWGIE